MTTATKASQQDCYCCGRIVPVNQLARMLCHPEVAICVGCAEWLATWSRTLVRAVPVLKTENLSASITFWQAAGFDVKHFSDDFAVAELEGVELHLVEAGPEGRDRSEAYLHVRDVDAVHTAWNAAGMAVSALRDEPWGMREFNLVDPGGNRLRIGQSI